MEVRIPVEFAEEQLDPIHIHERVAQGGDLSAQDTDTGGQQVRDQPSCMLRY